ncbi:MAG: hypothetical protein ACLRZ2_07895 [Veillonella sp.]
MKSRWGSCTPSKQLIKMNMRLLEGPQAILNTLWSMSLPFNTWSFQELSQLVAQFYQIGKPVKIVKYLFCTGL